MKAIADPFKQERDAARKEPHDWVKWYSQNTLLHNLWREGKICRTTDAEIMALKSDWMMAMRKMGYSEVGILSTWKRLEEASRMTDPTTGEEKLGLLYDPGWKSTIYQRNCHVSMGFIPFNVNLAAGNMADAMMMARGWIHNPDGKFQRVPKGDQSYTEMIYNPCWIAVGERDETIATWVDEQDATVIAVLGAGYGPEFWTTGFPLERRRIHLYEQNPRVDLGTFITDPEIMMHFRMIHGDVSELLDVALMRDELAYDAIVMPGLASYIYDSLPTIFSVILPRMKADARLIFELELENPAMEWVLSTLTWLESGAKIYMPEKATEAMEEITQMVSETSHGEAQIARMKIIDAGWDRPQMIMFEVRKATMQPTALASLMQPVRLAEQMVSRRRSMPVAARAPAATLV